MFTRLLLIALATCVLVEAKPQAARHRRALEDNGTGSIDTMAIAPFSGIWYGARVVADTVTSLGAAVAESAVGAGTMMAKAGEAAAVSAVDAGTMVAKAGEAAAVGALDAGRMLVKVGETAAVIAFNTHDDIIPST